ncbi:hypothetical protein TA3x_005513 [Tundrisphaera sp. TA3]|uniref:hypothetical protein n=1 Tax=Tundrisphaera sp. TA3 TaxID=3435775 RepID=UPI003EC14FFB
MRRGPAIVVGAATLLVAGGVAALASGRIPLGVPGEWEWLRLQSGPDPIRVAVALAAIAAYAIFVALGSRSLAGRVGPIREWAWLAGLAAAAAATQAAVQDGAPEGYGLEKWVVALHNSGSSGYLSVAGAAMDDPARFLADYPAWIARQDALHIGTHPPGLFVATHAVLRRMQGSAGLARGVVDLAPPSTVRMIRAYRDDRRLSLAEAATVAAIGALTLLACSLTVVPLYGLARASGLGPMGAWASAAIWPVVPSALMFQPTADAAFPLLSASALALAAWGARDAGRLRGLLPCLAAGVILGVGMFFTLAFLPVGLVVGVLLATTPALPWPRRIGLISAVGVGFLAVTLGWWAATSGNPFAIWYHNQANHARFYVEHPRTYWAWVLENPIELAIGLGLPASLWVAIGLRSPRTASAPRVAWITLGVLAFLTLGGRSLSEVGRLWLPFMPALLVAAGAGFGRLGGGPRTLAATVALIAGQTLLMQCLIQVVYPIVVKPA